MRKHYLILVLFTVVMGALKAAPKKDSIEYLQKERAMGYCNPPIINADSLLLEYYTNQPLSATGGTPPYTYTFSPAISSSELVSPPDSSITYTITVTGADGCDSVYYAHYVPLPPESTGACAAIFISEYIQDTVNHDDAIELYNPTSGTINLSGYYLFGTTNGSLLSTPFFISLHGIIDAHKTFLIANTLADTALTHKAGMLSDSLNFGGSDIVTLAQATISPPTLTVNFLDEVGTIYPLPTDSGWAVARGSTKNHTLVRKSSVNQGSVNWSTCKTEWNVYARGTFSYIGSYNNVCTPEDAILYLSLANDTVICGEPSYYEFDIMIQADSAKMLNDCLVEISFPPSVFGNDNDFHGSYVTIGADFTPNAYNDYSNFSAGIYDTTLSIQLGNNALQSNIGTIVDSIPKVLAHVSLQIQNSCATGNIAFTDEAHTRGWSHYVYEDSTFDHLDSTKSWFDTCCPYQCGDTTGPPYPCNPYCCDTDEYGNCIAICYDTCYTYPVYCYDTIWHYKTDSVYNYEYISNVAYSNTIYSDSLIASGCPMQMDATTTSVNAGTIAYSIPPNSSILNITGVGFGANPGNIWVANANGPGTCKLDTMDILSWSENLIKVRMPSYIINNSNVTPGSGPIKVSNTCAGVDSSNLRINYNIESDYRSHEKTRVDIVMQSPSVSLLFHCDTSVVHNAKAYACVKKAVREWNCFTGVHWKVGSDTTLETESPDGVSVIYFSHTNTEFSNANVLMKTVCQPEADRDCYDEADSLSFYNEADIAMRLDRYLPDSAHWNYDTTYRSMATDSFYFYDYILHELGHAHGLNHINDKYSLMYWENVPGHRDSIDGGSYYPGPTVLYGAFDVINTSKAYDPTLLFGHCSDYVLVPDTAQCRDATLDVPDITNPLKLDLYPNPISYGDLTVTYSLNKQSDIGFRIYDCIGRLIMDLGSSNKPAGLYNIEVNTSQLAQGVYLFTAIINGEYKTIKFVKLQ